MQRVMRAVKAALVILLGLLWLLVPQVAQARAAQNDKVGYIQGEYYNVSEGGPAYLGVKDVWNQGDCVDVQRKTVSTGAWTTSGVYNYRDCVPNSATNWSIRNPDYISNTAGIRLFNIGTHSYVVLCSSKSDCLAT